MKSTTLRFFALGTLLILFSSSVSAGEFLINPKIGLRNWSNDVYTIQGNTITFDDAPQASFAIRGTYITDFGLAGSVEVMGSSVEADNETAGSRLGTASESALTLMGQYYFLRDKKFSPYVGLGVGSHLVEISDSNTNARLDGYSGQLHFGGIINVGERLGINLEYKYYKFKVEDDNNDEMESNVSWFGVGATWKF